jgi:hypothetical protein
MSKTNELIRAIVDEDFVSAKEIANNLFFTAVSDELDSLKQEVAAELFNDVSEVAKADFDKDGILEPAKAEVLGSRINAAVKSGNLTPAQAAKTKNKGMFR